MQNISQIKQALCRDAPQMKLAITAGSKKKNKREHVWERERKVEKNKL